MLLSGFPRRFVLTGAFLSVFFALSAQSPNAIPYQAVARNSAGNLLQNQPVRVRFSIHEGTASGTVVYQETHTATTNNLGLFSVNIGQGTPISGTFAGINWGGGLKFTQVELDPSGGTVYLDMGTVQMLSVPYALYAASSGSAANESDPQVSSSTTNAVPKWNGTTLTDGSLFDNGTNVGIGTAAPSQKLDIVGTVKTIGFQMPTGATSGYVLQSDASGNASWVNPTSLTVTGDNLGNHTASQNINLGSRFLSNNGSDYGLQFYGGLTYSQSGTSASFNLGNSTNPFTEMSFNTQDRRWLLNAGGDKFQLLDGTNGNSAPFVVEKQSANDRLHISGNYVGIGTGSPTELLDVNGRTKTANFQMTFGAVNGYVLRSDASGNASWVSSESLSIVETDPQVVSGNTNYVSKWNGSALTDGQIYDNGSSVGIGTSSPAQKLDVVGTVKTVGFQMPTGAGAGLVLQSDASGNASWVNPTSLTVTGDNLGNHTASQNINLGSRFLSNNGSDYGLQFYSGLTYSQLGTSASFNLGNSTNPFTEMAFQTQDRSWLLNAGGDKFQLLDGTNSNSAPFVVEKQSANDRLHINGNYVGIGTSSPTELLDVNGRTKTTNFQMTNGAASGYLLQSDASGNAFWVASGSIFTDTDDQNLSLLGSTLSIDNGNSVNLSSLADNLGNHTASQNINLGLRYLSGNGTDYGLRFYGGLTYSQSGTLASFNLGNSTNPFTEMAFQTQDRSWLLNAGGDKFQLLDGTNGNSTPFVVEKQSANDRLHINGNYVGIGTSSPAELLDVNGRTKTTNLQMTSGAASGYVLQSDGSGNASWAAPSSVFTTTDDQTLSLSGTTLSIVDGNSVNISQKALTDADADTKVEVEKNTDEDKIRFTLGGTEYFEMNGPHLNVKNSGGSVFLGQYAGQNDDLDASDNVGIGTYALSANTTGFLNTALGKSALASNISGTYNVAVGNNALNSITTTGLNTAIGSSAGANATGTGNVFIGYGAGENETANDKLYIHNSNSASPLIWGDFVTRYLNINGNLGIGTTTPSQKLDVVGTAKVTNFQMTNGAANGYVLQSDASGNAAWVATTSLSVTETDPQVGSSTTGRVPRWTGTTLSDGSIFDDGSNIGIGTTSPGQKLDVQSSASVTMRSLSTGNSAYVNAAAPSGAEAALKLSTYSSGSTSDRWVFGKTTTAESGSNMGSDFFINRYSDAAVYLSQPFRIVRSTGYVGINNATPAAQLDISGTAKTTNFQMTSGATSGYVLQSDASGNASWVAPSTLSTATPAKIQDADADTKIQTEESSNEDKIRFDLGGTEQFIMDGPHLQVKNSGSSVFIGDGAGSNDDLTGNHNAFIGFAAGLSTTAGNSNVALGSNALRANATGSGSVALGYQALYSSTGSGNVAIGALAGQNCTGAGSVFIGYLTGQNETGSNKLYIDNSNTTNPLIWGDFSSNYLNFNANVGIGTSSPTQAQLVISGSESASVGGYGFINSSGNTGTSSGTHNYSIYASDRIAGSEFNAHSDARIKHIQGRSDNAADLQTLMQLKITDYTMIDTVAKGSKPYKKVIAQEVEQVYPQAVSKMAGVAVPDIYQLSKIENGFVALANSGVQVGERVKLIFGEKQTIAEVTAVSEKGFQTNLTTEHGQVFVYGREVSDFRTVDYEAISMLNVSATQELVKRLSDLEKQNAETKRRNEQLQGQVQDLNQWREKVEAMLQTLPHK